MRNVQTIANWEKRQLQKRKRIKLLGWTFLLLALGFSCFAYFAQTDFVREYVAINATEQEAYYMLSLVISFMGIFCLNSIKNKL